MKNLKKVLALVLAFACAFTMFASAAFTDQADIKSTEAVDMLSALGVIKGYSDGSYKPDKIVTRAEMAKMIYVIRNGGSDVVTQYEGYKTPFTDVENVNHWAKGYIAFCYANGIIAGKSATKFDPDAPVTGQEAAKMGLVMLGYDPARAGLVGKTWATNTTNLATQKDLFAGYSHSITLGSPRQFAAQLLYNTLWAGTVKWSEDAKAYEDVVEYVSSGDGVTAKQYKVTVAKKYMGLEEETGTFEGTSKIHSGLKNTESKVNGKTITFVPENGNVWLGEDVKVLYKESKDGNNGLDHHDTIYGITLSGNSTAVNSVKGDLDKDEKSKIKVGDTKYDVYSSGVEVIVNYNVDAKTTMDAAKFNSTYGKASADTVKLIQNREGKVAKAYIEEAKFTKVTSLTDKKISLAGIGSLDINDDMDLDKNVAKNDIVSVTTLYKTNATDDGAFNVIAKADVVKDVKVTNVKGAAGAQKVMIDGKYAEVAVSNKGVMDGDYKTEVELNGTYDFVMYGNYWVAAKEVAASTKDIALLTAVGGPDDIKKQVEVMFQDGTKKIYEYDHDADDANSPDFNTLRGQTGQIFSYTLVGDSKIQLKQNGLSNLTHDNTKAPVATGKFYDADRKTLFFANNESAVVAKEAMAFVKVGKDYYAYSIDAIKSINVKNDDGSDNVKSSTVELFLNGDKEIVAFMVELANKPGATASSAQYGYIVEDLASSSIDGTKYQEITVWNGKEVVTLKVEASSLTGYKKGNVIKYNVGANGVTDKADLKQITVGNAGAVKGYDEGSLLTLYKDKKDTKDGGSSAYKVAKDCVVVGINTKDSKSAEGAAVQQAQFVKGSTTEVDDNILYVLNEDNEVVVIFADSDNVITTTNIAPGAAYVAK